MSKTFTILGCGSSLGSPWITEHWGNCNKNDIKNVRTRCSAHINYNGLSILIDTSPDIKQQFKKNKIKNVDAVIYTHEHSDQASGIFELRPFTWINKKKIPVYGSQRTINELKKKYTFCFFPKSGYLPILKPNIIKNNFRISKKNNSIYIKSFDVDHGMIKATGYVFEKICYISDCNNIDKKNYKHLKGLRYLIIDCLRIKKHPSHFNLDEAVKISNFLNPKKTILTNLHVDFDYKTLKKMMPSNIIPAYDGLKFNF